MSDLKYTITLKDAATSVLRTVQGAFGGFARHVGGLFRGLTGIMRGLFSSLMSLPSLLIGGGGLAGFLTKSLGAAMEAEAASRGLAEALKVQGTYSAAAAKRLEDYATALQRVTTYGDEEIKNAMAFGVNMGVTADRIEEVTRAAMGLAKRTGMDLNTAMGLFGRTAEGVSARLAMYGIKIDETLSPQERLNELIRKGTDYFGLAAAEADTLGGRWKQLKEIVGDWFETVGLKIADVFKLKELFEELRRRVDEFVSSVAGQDAIERWVKRVRDGLEGVAALFRAMFGQEGTTEQRAAVFENLGRTIGDAIALAVVGGTVKAVEFFVSAAPRIGAAIWQGFRGLMEATAPKLSALLGRDPLEKKAREQYLAERKTLEPPAEYIGGELYDPLAQEKWEKEQLIAPGAQKRLKELYDALVEKAAGKGPEPETAVGVAQEQFRKSLAALQESLKPFRPVFDFGQERGEPAIGGHAEAGAYVGEKAPSDAAPKLVGEIEKYLESLKEPAVAAAVQAAADSVRRSDVDLAARGQWLKAVGEGRPPDEEIASNTRAMKASLKKIEEAEGVT